MPVATPVGAGAYGRAAFGVQVFEVMANDSGGDWSRGLLGSVASSAQAASASTGNVRAKVSGRRIMRPPRRGEPKDPELLANYRDVRSSRSQAPMRPLNLKSLEVVGLTHAASQPPSDRLHPGAGRL